MSLFQDKILKKHLPKDLSIPIDHLTNIKKWKQLIESKDLIKQSEVAMHAPFMQQIMIDVLGYQAIGSDDNYTIAREYAISKQQGTGSVDLALGYFNSDKTNDQILAPFELKGAKTKDLDAIMSGRHKTPVQQAWEYARDIKGCEWVMISNLVELRLYSVAETSLVYEKFEFTKLTQPEEYQRFITLLHADNLLSGKTKALLQESHKADKDITDQLYADYKILRQNLIAHLITENPKINPGLLIQPAQKLLDRMLFIAFAEDKGLIPDNTIKQAYEHADPYNPRPIYQNFKGLFSAVDKGNTALNIPAYNGGLFAEDEFLDQLHVSDQICKSFKNLAEYDFDSDISVTVLGHIFEQSIADLEELTEKVDAGEAIPLQSLEKTTSVKGKRKKDGVVYTPDHITAFIVEHTLGEHINQQFETCFANYGQYKTDGSIQWKKLKQAELKFWYDWQEKLKQIKVVDPACGSGAFLVAAFDYLFAEYKRLNERLAELTGQPGVFDLNKEILNNNLFGVDINDESIEITKLSLWLKTAEKGKPLTSLDANIQAGNSLGLDASAPGSGFCWQVAFSEIIEQGGFDVVLGNPPYVRQELLGEVKPWLEQHYQVYHGVVDLYAYFFELGLKLLKANGKLGFISSATFFKTGSGQALRQFLASNYHLKKAVDFGDLQVFEGVTTYPAILIFENNRPDTQSQTEILVLKDKLPENLAQTFAQQKGLMQQNQLSGESWQLEDSRLHQLRHKLTHQKDGTPYPTLKETYGSPYRGVLTGFNEAFVINRQTRDNLINQDPKSAELIKPFLEGKDLKKWHAQSRNLYLIAIPKFWTRQQMGIESSETIETNQAWSFFSQNYPALAEYLLPYQTKAQKRSDKGEFWWELRACAYYEEFEKPKVIYNRFMAQPLFCLDKREYYFNNALNLIPKTGFFELGLFSSKCSWMLLTADASTMSGGFYQIHGHVLEKLSIPIATKNQKTIISELTENCQSLTEQRYAIESGFARRLVEDLCPEDKEPKLNQKSQAWWTLDFKTLQAELKKSFKLKAKDVLIPVAERNDWQSYFEAEKTKIAALNQQIQILEQQLNQEVYQLFDLTEEEIKLIESNI
ncbi:MAG: N-6 DNA methylase [Pseudomonadota bacterium]|nr:N-6 DNA methylase [Pseudomonadota bacterium]